MTETIPSFFHSVAKEIRWNEASLHALEPMDRTLFKTFGAGPIQSLTHKKLHHAFEHQVRQHPNAIAVEQGFEKITYGELDNRASQLAEHMVQMGIKPGHAVGIFLQRSINMIVGMLATLKTGACYVPQHVGIAPPEHLSHVVKVANIHLVLTEAKFQAQLPNFPNCQIIALDKSLPEVVRENLLPLPSGSTDRCFILFTSGTTGAPNGVQVTHRNVCNIVLTQPGDLGVKPGTRVGQLLNIAFDMSAWEIYVCLCHGGTLLIRNKDIQKTAGAVDVIIATPSILAKLDVEACQQVRTVALAGEPCPEPLAKQWSGFCQFYNCCGPTETTIVNTMQEYQGETLSVGTPTPNNTVYVLDDQLSPLPIGEVGEMWAGGDCVTEGYLNNNELTQERYKPDPFLAEDKWMFRTRDLGKWNEQGELIHLGRTDDQVKVKGFRVELTSVNNALERAEGCQQAITLKVDAKTLVSFVAPESVSVTKARASVEHHLPYYCVPESIIPLPRLPMTSRGKVDKNQLLKLVQEAAQ